MLGLAGIVWIIGVLCSVASFAAGIWLIVVAFKRSTLWGLLTMLVPFAGLVFVIKFWQDARKPFLASMVTGLGSLVFYIVGAGFAAASTVSGEVAGKLAADPALQTAIEHATSEDHRSAAPVHQRAAAADHAPESGEPKANDASAEPELSRLLAKPTAIFPEPQAAAKPAYDVDAVSRDGFAPVALRDAAQLVGRRVKLVTTNGRVHRGEILRADAHMVSLARWLHGGSAVLDFPKSEIESLQVDVN